MAYPIIGPRGSVTLSRADGAPGNLLKTRLSELLSTTNSDNYLGFIDDHISSSNAFIRLSGDSHSVGLSRKRSTHEI